jgi:hypothetical protein
MTKNTTRSARDDGHGSEEDGHASASLFRPFPASVEPRHPGRKSVSVTDFGHVEAHGSSPDVSPPGPEGSRVWVPRPAIGVSSDAFAAPACKRLHQRGGVRCRPFRTRPPGLLRSRAGPRSPRQGSLGVARDHRDVDRRRGDCGLGSGLRGNEQRRQQLDHPVRHLRGALRFSRHVGSREVRVWSAATTPVVPRIRKEVSRVNGYTYR